MSMTRMLFYSNSFHKYPLTTKLTGVCFSSSTDFRYYCKLRSSASWSESVSSSESVVAASGEERKNGGMAKKNRKSKVEYSNMFFFNIF